MSSHPLFEIVTTSTGAISIRNKLVNETMHSPVGPWLEANSLYINQSGLREHIQKDHDQELVIFDIGLGAASNAIAALTCIHSIKDSKRPVRLISYERDMELLRFTLANAHHFDHLLGYEEALNQLLETGRWSDSQIQWELREGDFLELINNEVNLAHIVFYDPYSPNVNSEMWTMQAFQRLRRKCREPQQGATSLYTYSLATRIRAAMIIAGFYVGHGAATGAKTETTEASTEYQRLKQPLGEPWFLRWQRSHSKQPFDCSPGQEPLLNQRVLDYIDEVRLFEHQKPVSK